jgi:DNA-binding CsgD family transcriptional regulator/PAS domain-containing protein
VIDRTSGALVEFCSGGLPMAASAEYSRHFAAHNPRISPILRQRAGEVCWDYKFMDEEAMDRDPFYSEFLPGLGLRYFISAVLDQTAGRTTVVSVQRTRQKGHVSGHEIELMNRLCPHFQRAYTMRKLLGAPAPSREDLLEDALDLLTDGIALLRRDGGIVYVNSALRRLAASNADFRIDRNAIEFAAADLRCRFAAALRAVERGHNSESTHRSTDFAVPREGLPPYTVSVRPLLRAGGETTHPDVAAMLLVHDPLQQNLAAGKMLQDLYGLTNAEAQLVQALGTGMTAVAYARSRSLSVTTVYTHLRRTREKTGWKSVAELTRRFHELNVALRAS